MRNEMMSRAEKFSTPSRQNQHPLQNSLPLLLTRSRAIFSAFQGGREAVRVGDTNLHK